MNKQRKRSSRIHSARLQVGFFTFDLGLALLVAAIATVIGFISAQRAADADLARLQADAILTVRAAAHRLVMNNYIAYQSASPISIAVVDQNTGASSTIPIDDGDNADQTRNPTLTLLRSLQIGVDASMQDEGVYKSLLNATYDIKITRTAQCSTNPADPNCHVTGLVCLNKVVKNVSSPAGDVDEAGLSIMMARMGGFGAVSLIGNPTFLISANGAWQENNPYGGATGRAGIVCARFGWGTDDDYLRVKDTRDPGFMGGETVSGLIPGSTYTLQANGDTNVTGNVNVGDAAAKTGSVTINGSAVAGTACAANQAGAMVWGDVGGTQQLLKCQSGIWTVTGVPMSSEGAACAGVEGKIAQNSGGLGLVCRDGAYRMISDMVGRGGIYQVGVYYRTALNGAVVPQPVCSSGTTPHFVPLGVIGACTLGGGAANCANNTGAFVGSVDSAGVVTIVGSDGTSSAGDNAQLAVASVCATY
jgi:hypothetical protein